MIAAISTSMDVGPRYRLTAVVDITKSDVVSNDTVAGLR